MPLFDSLFGKSRKPDIAGEFAKYQQFINWIVEQENRKLQALGLPLPSLVKEMTYEEKPGRSGAPWITLKPPEFSLPPHRSFFLMEDLVLTITAQLDDAEYYMFWDGVKFFIEYDWFKPIWTNRFPYEVFNWLQYPPSSGISCRAPGDLTAALHGKQQTCSRMNLHETATRQPPLESVPGFSVAEVWKRQTCVRLFDLVTRSHWENMSDPCRHFGRYRSGTLYLPKDVWRALPEISPGGENFCAVKILPAAVAKPGQMTEFLDSLRPLGVFVCFELLREASGDTGFRLRFPPQQKEAVLGKLQLYFPDAETVPVGNSAEQIEYSLVWLVRKDIFQPNWQLREFHVDPYAHFAELLDAAAPGERLCYQVMFVPVADQNEALFEYHLHRCGRFDRDRHQIKKLPGWLAYVSVSGTNENRVTQIAAAATACFGADGANARTLTPGGCYAQDVFPPRDFSTWFSLYHTGELAALAHFPISPLPLPSLETARATVAEPPGLYLTGETRVGSAVNRRRETLPITLPEEARDRHVYIVGKSGTGKSSLILNIARSDIKAGRGLAVIDPHGDLARDLLETIPAHRTDDCIFFSPKIAPVSLDILNAGGEHEIDLLTDDLVTMFRRTSESWGDKMQAILQMAFQTLLRVPGSSFTDITPLLTDESFRRRIINQINHPQLAAFWQHRFEMRQAEPILIRMDRLTTSGVLRQVLTQTKNSLNFYDVVTEGKILLADLSKGFLGESTSHLLGSIMVSQVQLAAMRQAQLPMEQRVPFSLFVDEVQNFTTSAFGTILSEARKQKLRLCVAHQFVSQLPQEIQKAIFGNVGTMFFFAMSPDDLGAARHELGSYEPQDAANLPKYHAFCRPATGAKDTFLMMTEPPPEKPPQNFAAQIIENTRREYGAAIEMTPEGLPPLSDILPPPIVETAQSPPKENVVQTVPMDDRCPAPARQLIFATNGEKILHFLRQAEYLSQPQIIALTELLPPNASTALKKLVETGQIKTLDDRRPKIYFIGKSCQPTTHNLLLRDLLVKIYASGFAIRKVSFNEMLGELNPDLTVEFAPENESTNPAPLLCYFELDRGTEGVQELIKKAERYSRIIPNRRVGFIFEHEPDMQLARSRISYPFILYNTLNGFITLADGTFRRAAASESLTTFFGR